VCGEKFETRVSALSDAVDVYSGAPGWCSLEQASLASDWLDACNAVNNRQLTVQR